MFGDGIGDRGEIKDLMPILGVRLKKDLATLMDSVNQVTPIIWNHGIYFDTGMRK